MSALAPVAVVTDSDITSRLISARSWIETVDVSHLAASIPKIRGLAEWLKALDAVEDLRKQALTLEYIALRRVGGTEWVAEIPNSQRRSAAKWLASLPEETFTTLVDGIGLGYSPIAAYRAWVQKQERDRLAERLRRVQEEHDVSERVAWDETDTWEKSESWKEGTNARLREAADTILTDLIRSGEPFTAMEAAYALADAIEIDAPGISREEIARGLTGVVNKTIRSMGKTETVLADGETVEMPLVVVFRDSEFGWIKVNFFEANLPQLVAMADDHLRRAEHTMARAQELRKLADFFATHATHPEEPLVTIERRLRHGRRLRTPGKGTPRDDLARLARDKDVPE